MKEEIYRDEVEARTRELADDKELPVRGEVVRIVSGELAGEEAMIEGVERERFSGRTFVWLRVYGFPWSIEEAACSVVRAAAAAERSGRGHRWGRR